MKIKNQEVRRVNQMQQNDDRCYYYIYVNLCDEQDEECIDVDTELENLDYTGNIWKEMSYLKYVDNILDY